MDTQNLIPTIAHTTATLVGLMATAAGFRSILAPRPFAESFGFPQTQTVDPFIPVVGVRNIGLGLSLLAFSTMKNTQAMGIVLLCNLASMVGDTVICWKKGCTQKSINSHLIASIVFAVLGGYLSISTYKQNDPDSHTNLIHELRTAILEVGFLYIKNHGVPTATIKNLVDVLPILFSLPDDAKEQVALVNSPHFLGFSKFGSETTANVQDEREQFEFANERPDVYGQKDSQPLYLRLQGPNQWPFHPSIPHLRRTVEDYVCALQDLANRFLELMTVALALPPSSLSEFTGPQDRLKLVHYRPAPGLSADTQSQGVGVHKDSSGWMTFLLQASDPSIKGLQVLNKQGRWLDVPPVPGTLVVNMGQAFEVATNGVCKATAHRVLLPPGDYDRYSVPFFQGVKPDLTKEEFKKLWTHFDPEKWNTTESIEGQLIDSPFLRGNYDTWGEAQLRTKIRSHRDVGKRHYPEVYDKYVCEG